MLAGTAVSAASNAGHFVTKLMVAVSSVQGIITLSEMPCALREAWVVVVIVLTLSILLTWHRTQHKQHNMTGLSLAMEKHTPPSIIAIDAS